jgi:phospholipase/carboxylesterase
MNEIVIKSKIETKKLIFVFHGYGANKENLLPIGESFADNLNDAEVHLADGPELCDAGCGYQWFPLVGDDISMWKGAFQAAKAQLVDYVDSVLENRGLTYRNVVLSGFSQGAMVSLELGLDLSVAAIVAFSGALLDHDIRDANSGNKNVKKDTKILITHGELDAVVPVSEAYDAEETLKALGLGVTKIICSGTAHSIDNCALASAIKFLKQI